MKYTIRHLPNPPHAMAWPVVTILIYAASGMVAFAIVAMIYGMMKG